MTLRAGFARRDITQPLGTPSSLGLFRTVTEVWDPLSATAVVLESDGERIALVGLDLCGLLEASHRSIREAVAARTGLPADRVVLNVSHTHSAPVHQRRPAGAAPAVRAAPAGRRLRGRARDRGRRGRRRRRPNRTVPARVAIGHGTVERVAGNRRPKLPDGRTVHRYGRPPEELRALPEGLIDPQVAVIRFDRPDGGAIGAILSYSCHPTASGLGIPTNVSADFVGHGRTAIEAGGYEGTCVFLQGCAGNQGTGKWVSGTAWEDTVAMGERFARGVAEALRTAAPVADGGLVVARSSLPLELDPFPPLAEQEAAFERAARDTEFADIVSIGDRARPGPPPGRSSVARRSSRCRSGRTSRWSCCRARSSSSTASRCGPDRRSRTPSWPPTTTTRSSTSRPRPRSPTASTRSTGAGATSRPGQGERMADEAVRLLGGLRA